MTVAKVLATPRTALGKKSRKGKKSPVRKGKKSPMRKKSTRRGEVSPMGRHRKVGRPKGSKNKRKSPTRRGEVSPMGKRRVGRPRKTSKKSKKSRRSKRGAE